MARRGCSAQGRTQWVIALTLVVAAGSTVPAAATVKYGDVQFSGSFTTQNLVRTADIDQLQFIQNRNFAYLRMDWDWFRKGQFIQLWEVPWVKESKFFLLYRGVYDGFYDLAPGGNQRGLTRFDDLVGGPIEGNRAGTIRGDRPTTPGDICDPLGPDPRIGNCLRQGAYSRLDDQDRDNIKRENELREVYVDLKLKDAPVSFRIGRQQVIWGEADQFRMMDIWNPLDLRWHLQQEPFTEIRQPLWMIKGLWDMPVFEVPLLGTLSNSFIEVVWNPFDYKPGIIPAFLPRPWSAPIPHPLRQGQIQVLSDEAADFVSPDFNLNGTTFLRGDFKKNPAEASGIGGRFHTVTEQGFEFTMNYLYHRGRGIGAAASNAFAVRFKPNGTEVACNPGDTNCLLNADLSATPEQNPEQFVGTFDRQGEFQAASFGETGIQVRKAFINAEIIHPYQHIFGFTANYFEPDYTQAVFRMETAYALDIPFISASMETRIREDLPECQVPKPPDICIEFTKRQRIHVRGGQPGLVRLFPGIEKRDVWAIMLGFDRPTWIRWLNRKTTWFLTGQFFLSYIPSGVTSLRGSQITASETPYFAPTNPDIFRESLINSGGVGQWLSGPFAGLTERTQSSNLATNFVNTDRIRKWESLITFAAFSFYKGGSVMPFVAMAVDPVNQSWLMQPHVNYFLTNNFIMRVGGKVYFNWGGHMGPTQDPWGAGGLNSRRDELDVRFTLQF
jgi:hypothetical protein